MKIKIKIDSKLMDELIMLDDFPLKGLHIARDLDLKIIVQRPIYVKKMQKKFLNSPEMQKPSATMLRTKYRLN